MIRAMLLMNYCQNCDARMWERFEETGLEPDALAEGGPSLWERIGMSERARGAMTKALSLGWIERELDACEKLGVRLVTCRDPIYPVGLLELKDAPILLYVRGGRLSIPGRAVGIVGTRRCSAYAGNVASEIGKNAALRGWSVVSGGAKGVDGLAHAGCLDEDGMTAAVLGTGVDVVYPSEHRKLFDRIMETGALFSEYPLGTGGEGWRFPKRNRIIAGLSLRTVVVEAPHKSGAMITARQAAEAGREVWAVPGRIGDDRCSGSNRLIFDGAFPLIDMETFFGVPDPQKNLFSGDFEAAGGVKKEAPQLSDVEKILVALLTNHGDRTIDNLAGEAKMGAAEVLKAMSILSLRGVTFSSGPGRYRLVD
ncbi:MAG: DNA-processing protein DprA [Synergistaceae bacterium]|jgi:DNA processing protein|nr:DNA-processing protein DprA [Synergistaceae bacterium]